MKTSFTRTSIYNYFQTKEEIFLALFQREYEAWIEDLDALRCGHRKLSVDAFSDELARTLERRERLLKLMAMNHYDMEANSRIENLVAFKKAYGGSLLAVTHCLEKFFPRMTDEDVQGFLYAFFPFMFGIYPYTAVTEQQRTAMELAGVGYVRLSVRELTRSFTAKLLPGISNVREEVRRTRRSVSCLNDSPAPDRRGAAFLGWKRRKTVGMPPFRQELPGRELKSWRAGWKHPDAAARWPMRPPPIKHRRPPL